MGGVLDELLAKLREADRRIDEAHAETAAVRVDAQRRIDEARAETTAARAETAAARTSEALAAARHEELLAELREVKELLRWKSRTSTRNPTKRELTHEFIIMAGRKKQISGSKELEHIPKVGPVTGAIRDPITTAEAPRLRRGEIVRVSVMSRQTRTAARAIREHEENGEYLLQRGYMANGIDFRQNVKAIGKRKFAEVIDLTETVSCKRPYLTN